MLCHFFIFFWNGIYSINRIFFMYILFSHFIYIEVFLDSLSHMNWSMWIGQWKGLEFNSACLTFVLKNLKFSPGWSHPGINHESYKHTHAENKCIVSIAAFITTSNVQIKFLATVSIFHWESASPGVVVEGGVGGVYIGSRK